MVCVCGNSFDGGQNAFLRCCWAENGAVLASAGGAEYIKEDTRYFIKLWNPSTGALIKSFGLNAQDEWIGHSKTINALAW